MRSLNTNNIVIVCEGTETEFAYFDYFKQYVSQHFPERFSSIRIVPQETEILTTKKSKKQNSKRVLQQNEEKKFFYYIKEEKKETDYNKYKHNPARFAREAYLFLVDKDYEEAWAVYDLDDKNDLNHDNHKCAYELTQIDHRLQKAYSAYSFEEWILLHYERTKKSFRDSAYREKKDLDSANTNSESPYFCNDRFCVHKPDCSSDCLGDYLVKQGHVENYSKSDGGKYAKMIIEDINLRHKAYVNAAWSRALNNAVFYECNPYTDVDLLVMRLLGEKYDINWVKLNIEFVLNEHHLVLIENDDNTLSIQHNGEETCVLPKDSIYWCGADYQNTKSAVASNNINFSAQNNSPKKLIAKPFPDAVLCIKYGSQEFYFEV